MEIRFERSGGFAGRATNLAGVVHFAGEAASVTCDSTGYHRVLEAAEAANLQSLAMAALTAKAASTATGQADQFQYVVSIQTGDGRAKSVTLDPRADPVADATKALSLDSWVLRELSRIWDDKLAKIKK